MANSPQAIKRARQAENKRQHNAGLRSQFRTFVKRVVYAIDGGKREEAFTAYKAAVPVIDKMVTKGIIHQNKADRHKSRLNKRIKAMAA